MLGKAVGCKQLLPLGSLPGLSSQPTPLSIAEGQVSTAAGPSSSAPHQTVPLEVFPDPHATVICIGVHVPFTSFLIEPQTNGQQLQGQARRLNLPRLTHTPSRTGAGHACSAWLTSLCNAVSTQNPVCS